MKCPYCGSESLGVVDSRSTGDSIRRRRVCESCRRRFTTYERVEDFSITVRKRDDTRESFDRNKVLAGIMKACEKRPVSRERMEAIVDKIEGKIKAKGMREVSSKDIGDMVVKELYKLDEIAYIRFASVYNNFASPEDFRKVAVMLNKKSKYYAKRR